MEYALLGFPADGPTLELSYEQFAYAGKFITPRTGKTVARDDVGAGDETAGSEIVGAAAFNEEHTDADAARVRYITVRDDRRGEGIGSRLLWFTAEVLADRFETVAIAANNPVAYRACYRAGFVWTGSETGIAELRLRYAPASDRDAGRYRDGLEVFADRDLPAAQQTALDNFADGPLPSVVAVPEDARTGI